MQTLRGMQQNGHLQYFSARPFEEVRARGYLPAANTPNRREMYGKGLLSRMVDGLMVDVDEDDPIGLEIVANAIRCNVPCVMIDNDVSPLVKAKMVEYKSVYPDLVDIRTIVEDAYRRLCALVAPRIRNGNTDSHILRRLRWDPPPEMSAGTVFAC